MGKGVVNGVVMEEESAVVNEVESVLGSLGKGEERAWEKYLNLDVLA